MTHKSKLDKSGDTCFSLDSDNMYPEIPTIQTLGASPESLPSDFMSFAVHFISQIIFFNLFPTYSCHLGCRPLGLIFMESLRGLHVLLI